MKNLLIEVMRSGSQYKARYAGDSNYVFGATPEEATRRLKYDWRIYGRMPGINSVQGAVLKGR